VPKALVLAAVFVLAGCGSSTKTTARTANRTTATTPTSSAPPATTTLPSALQAEANATAAGDIPDNQAFLTFRNSAAGYSLKYPEGWAQRGGGKALTFRDKNNIVRVVVANGTAPTAATVHSELASLKGARVKSGPAHMTIAGAPALKVTYTTVSAPNAVTGKRVTLVVDRYYLWHGGKRAIVDLGTPVGVDNVDAYRLMIQSFRWR
jgi:hypothetical protein